ncbi:MAG: sulfatase-like hydrolase/transferase [Cyclobacteriaceae bacterium]
MRLFIITFALLCLRTTSEAQPNIIFILIDDQRYDFLSYLDHPWIESPHIDQLAAKSMYFENAFVTTSLCSPSRASIVTGHPRPGFNHWVSFKGQGPYFDPTLNVDGQRIDKKGYTTDILTGYAIDFIKNNEDQERPYFLYLSHKAIHEWIGQQKGNPFFL